MRRDERTQHRPSPFHSQHIRLLLENTCRAERCLLEFYRDKIHRLCRGVSFSQKISGTTLIFREPCGLSLIKIKIKIIFSLRLGLATVWATGNKFITIILICRCGVRMFERSRTPPLQNYIYIILFSFFRRRFLPRCGDSRRVFVIYGSRGFLPWQA